MTTVLKYMRKEFLTLALLAGATLYSMGGSGGNAIPLSPASAMQSYHSVVGSSPAHGLRSAMRSQMAAFGGIARSGKSGSSRSFALGSSGPIFLN